jgi:hypothetical protein
MDAMEASRGLIVCAPLPCPFSLGLRSCRGERIACSDDSDSPPMRKVAAEPAQNILFVGFFFSY